MLPATWVRALATIDLASLPLGRWTPYGESWECGCPDTKVTKKKKKTTKFWSADTTTGNEYFFKKAL